MRGDFDYSVEPPSRLSRVVILLSTLGVVLIAAWVFTPILLARYAVATTATSAGPKPARESGAGASAATLARSAAATPAMPAATSDTTATTTAVAAAADDARPRRSAPSAPVSFAARASIPWPDDAPATAPSAPGAASGAAPASTVNARFAAINATTDAVDPVERVPMPRSRPSRLIAARLAIPLPRPRPDIVSEPDAPARPSAFDLQVDRMR